ncbi:MAG: hypothetical protein MJ211_07950 [Bacteroidales bacterium]|nr:hypothetical protein [Bacteroidales bacterium]
MKRNFCFSQQQLINRALRLSASCDRDFQKLSEFGFTDEMFKNLTELTSKFMNFCSDKINLHNITSFNENRKKLRKDIIKQIRLIQLKLEILNCQNSDIYSTLRKLKVYNVSDSKFLEEIKKVQGSSVILCSLGVSATQTGTLNSLIIEYKKSCETCISFNNSRKADSEERINIANDLLKSMSTICKMGKLVWKDVDDNKYNDYILY